MKLKQGVYWVGSGAVGLSAPGDCHTYLIEGEDALALVDCGVAANPQRILDNIKNDGLDVRKLRWCFLTHAHYDHAGGCAWLRENGVRIVGSPLSDAVLREGPVGYYGLTDAMKTVNEWRAMPLSQIDDIAADGQEFDLGGVAVRAIHTPGHSPDSVCYLASMPDGRGDLFSGDTVFYKGFISLLAPPFNDLAHYPKGIAALSGLHVDGLFPGHLMWVLSGGQQYIDSAHRAFSSNAMPVPKPFS